MHKIFFILSLVCLQAAAQSPDDYLKQVDKIATMERIGHQRIVNSENATLASNNFEVRYYRCEWETNPSVYYITGKVTAYFVMTAASSSISFDLMSSMTVDSVTGRV